MKWEIEGIPERRAKPTLCHIFNTIIIWKVTSRVGGKIFWDLFSWYLKKK